MAVRILDGIMAQHIRMPGFPQIIVRRGWAYQWLKSCGWDESERGYGSLDYAAFAPEAVQDELIPDDERDYWMGSVREDFIRTREEKTDGNLRSVSVKKLI